MPANKPKAIYLRDYRPPAYRIETVDLHFDLGEEVTTVRAEMAVAANEPGQRGRALVLDGSELELGLVAVDGRRLRASEYAVDDHSLTIAHVPDRFVLTVETRIRPQENSSLEGLYRSGAMFCTQCEAEGFRKITYFVDRPDVMARYTTTITADRSRYPVLLANGNLVRQEELADNRHRAVWQDPFPKPSYLFALVAGDLVKIEDRFTTRSGRDVRLEIYVEPGNADKCDHAMASLKKAMRWDEEVFGLEYDLDQYMIVAVEDFNMGAMENKGLNIFNASAILAKPQTATDDNFARIEAIVAHEYFHNWTGNRVTCRDWFQLSLKEGLTVFRDQEFSADMGSRPVCRINDVQTLRSRQFPEDNGPMAHPVRPESYMEINNFYTVTVYEKGAEVIRMLHTLLGAEGFRRGMDRYIETFDGRAATTDDFVDAMAAATGADLAQFRLWYSQAGTPEVAAEGAYDAESQSYTLTVRQSCPPTPGQEEKAPMHIPLAMGLLAADGRALPLRLAGESSAGGTERVLELRRREEVFRFVEVPAEPIPSLLRGFSAPVTLRYPYTEDELRFLLTHDHDPFNRWEAGQQLACRVLLALVDDHQNGRELRLDPAFGEVFGLLLGEEGERDLALRAQLLTLPDEAYLAEQMAVIDPLAIHRARQFVRRELAARWRRELVTLYRANHSEAPYIFTTKEAGRRRLKNTALAYLASLADAESRALCVAQFDKADNMTEQFAALGFLVYNGCPEADAALAHFREQWQDDRQVMDKWLSVQATAPQPHTLARVRELMGQPPFEITNPNKVRALIGAFAAGNPACFHAVGGEGYRFLAEQVQALDAVNPQVAARLLAPLTRWRRYDLERQTGMRAELERIASSRELSSDVYEIVAKSLA